MPDDEEQPQTDAPIDLTKPDPERRLTLEESLELICERYSEAIELLRKL